MAYYVVRITQNKRKPVPMQDYKKMKHQLETEMFAKWDNDKQNKIRENDYIGFILGPLTNLYVELYNVVEVKDITNREDHWLNSIPYTKNNGLNSVGHRKVLILTSVNAKIIDWNVWKRYVGYKENYMPRGNIKVKSPNPSLLKDFYL